MDFSPQRRAPGFADLLLFVGGVALPAVLFAVGANPGIILLVVLLAAGVWMTVWNDPGFLLGGFLFWITSIIITQATVAPGQVDNILPGLAVPFGWVPYVFLLGPVFLLLKSVRRLRESLSKTDLKNTDGANEQADDTQELSPPHSSSP
jgi:hypothetical protein